MDGFKRRAEVKKTNILEAALDLFMKFGVQKVSIAEIAKQANVSQVTIYNYFDSKHNLIYEVMIYYVETAWIDTEEILNSNIATSEKIKAIIFNKKTATNQMNQDFYNYFMKEYTSGIAYLEEFIAKTMLPRLVELIDEGKDKGEIDASVSNEAILFYIQMLREVMQREDVYQKILPLSEEITKLMFYGIVGKDHK
ncbi:TetR/AcrR family transcriptional regulator [Aquibacillus koreensis]|uniref:TetR/AcrR family transcriptional regulator n=1 Tax=Aquibacillus koreensis TaxID=279446 RepID=A0A9X4AJ43_9BACI|nr:TetR/AcrR family transcriptional regulator [Aquibacillus koreensis]MCT2537284.1 TetR/AcrR family transcriptional regulator [Aquibacillus koreensis]MDC3421631.1 TetR/AcrR family transcriptional regulator [Aquibacillus koreensis]